MAYNDFGVDARMLIEGDPDLAYGRRANNNGLWIVWRWECGKCSKTSDAMKLEETMASALAHECGGVEIIFRYGFSRTERGMTH